MTTAETHAVPTTSLDDLIRTATAAALQTLLALASNHAEPQHARLAAAEILRFASRRREPAPSRPRPPLTPLPNLSALIDLLAPQQPEARPDHPHPHDRTDHQSANAPDPAHPDRPPTLPERRNLDVAAIQAPPPQARENRPDAADARRPDQRAPTRTPTAPARAPGPPPRAPGPAPRAPARGLLTYGGAAPAAIPPARAAAQPPPRR